MTKNAIPTPGGGSGLVYCTSGFRGSALLAIRYADAVRDITGSCHALEIISPPSDPTHS